MSGKGVGFERIRRVTGYLTRFERMNDGKQAEVKERVKHASVKESVKDDTSRQLKL